ncbi:hypothetical protein Mapa_000589 [Marchantia paleacea]|nr:hypothetical protein Mapa_000589 [Marchantia paleacea]
MMAQHLHIIYGAWKEFIAFGLAAIQNFPEFVALPLLSPDIAYTPKRFSIGGKMAIELSSVFIEKRHFSIWWFFILHAKVEAKGDYSCTCSTDAG